MTQPGHPIPGIRVPPYRPVGAPETTESTDAYMYVFPHPYIPIVKFNLHIRHSKRLPTGANTKVGQLQPCIVVKVMWTWHYEVKRGDLNPSTKIRWQSNWSWRWRGDEQAGREHVPHPYTRQRGDVHARWDRTGGARLHPAHQNGTRFKTYELFCYGIFHLILLDCGWLQVTNWKMKPQMEGNYCIYLKEMTAYVHITVCDY